jgi:Protein of unknown function (DUF4058)
MPSPFPGMDPYLEDPLVWSDFHGTFLMCIRAELNRRLPEHYIARWDRHVWIDQPEEDQPRVVGRPDVFVTDALDRDRTVAGASIVAPAMANLPAVDPKGHPFLKIIDGRGRRVVTVVELLSPSNKTPGRYRDAYLVKRQEYFRTGTNVVELDLLRNGLRAPVEGKLPEADYYIVVSRASDYPKAGVWPVSVRDALPEIPVPLDPGVEVVSLPLRPCLERAYAEARFDEDLDYSQPPTPPLRDKDVAWARELLAQRRVKP